MLEEQSEAKLEAKSEVQYEMTDSDFFVKIVYDHIIFSKR